MCIPVMFGTEGVMLSVFTEKITTDTDLQLNLVMSGLCFYLYNELATMTLKVTGPVTASVAITGKVLTEEQKIGAGVAIAGVLLYSLIDDLIKPKATDDKKKAYMHILNNYNANVYP